MENFLNSDEKELLSLIQYHRREYENTKLRQGGLHPDDIEIIEQLDKGEKLLQSITLQRKNKEEEKRKPVHTDCPECEVAKERSPLREEKNQYGYVVNRFKCEACGIEYLDGRPNNGEDQLSLFDEVIKVLDELDNPPDEVKNEIAGIKKQREEFKKAWEIEKEALANVLKAEQLRAESLIQCRDYLLVAKLGKKWNSSNIGDA